MQAGAHALPTGPGGVQGRSASSAVIATSHHRRRRRASLRSQACRGLGGGPGARGNGSLLARARLALPLTQAKGPACDGAVQCPSRDSGPSIRRHDIGPLRFESSALLRRTWCGHVAARVPSSPGIDLLAPACRGSGSLTDRPSGTTCWWMPSARPQRAEAGDGPNESEMASAAEMGVSCGRIVSRRGG